MEKTALKLVKILQKAGFEAYFAGGCVRDMLLKQEPEDFDIVTSAKPHEIEKLLSHTIPVGKQFGVILAVEKGHHFEVATFRSDSGYSDGRRPDAVIFTSAEKDAKRRDFTINGMFYDPVAKEVLDFVGGQADLKARLIRFIGVPHERIIEDHLRILRAIRFKNAFNFQYHPDTYREIEEHAPLSDKVSGERLRDELNKILLAKRGVEALLDLHETGVLKYILPELEAMRGVGQPFKYHQEGDVWTHTMLCLKSLPKNASLVLRWATLLHDVGKPDTFKLKERIRFDHHVERSRELTQKILRRLRFSKKEIDQIVWLVEHHMLLFNLPDMRKGRQRHWFLKPEFKELLMLFKADIDGTKPHDYTVYNQIKALYKECLKHLEKEPKKLLDGREVMKILGLEPGQRIGKILDKLREKHLAGEIKTKAEAKKWLKDYY